MKNQEKKLIENFFATFPPTHAIPRTNEALGMKTVRLTPPILDLGCGDGKFALLTFGPKKITVGLDTQPEKIAQAQKSQAYLKTVVAPGEKMPFKDREFATVLANSVLEHVDDLERILREVARILRPGGTLALTVPTPLVSKYQFWSKFIPGWAKFKEKLWRHLNYFGERQWRKKLEKAGFKLARVEKTNSKQALFWADIFFPFFALGSIKKVVPFLEKRKVFGQSSDGATLLIVAKKK